MLNPFQHLITRKHDYQLDPEFVSASNTLYFYTSCHKEPTITTGHTSLQINQKALYTLV
jgi:hypothetical protein